MSALAGTMLMFCGALALSLACFGVLRLQGALARQHAATKAATLALGLMILGTGLVGGESGWWLRLGLLALVLLATLPVAAHALGRAASTPPAKEDAAV